MEYINVYFLIYILILFHKIFYNLYIYMIYMLQNFKWIGLILIFDIDS